MNIAIAAVVRWNGGSSRAIWNYQKAAPEYGCSVKLLLPFCDIDDASKTLLAATNDTAWADHLVCVFETHQFLDDIQLAQLQRLFPPRNLTIIDPDGRFSPTIVTEGDSNHDRHTRREWQVLFDALSPRILQPSLRPSDNARWFPYFGLEDRRKARATRSTFDLQYVGNNWYRWSAARQFLEAIQTIRRHLQRICFRGRWWNGVPCAGHESVTQSDPELFQMSRVEVFGSVPFADYMNVLGDGLITPVFVRPMLASQRLITPRALETMVAPTVPILWGCADYLVELYGTDARALCVNAANIDVVLELLNHPAEYLALSESIYERLWAQFNYGAVFRALLTNIAR